MNLYEILVPCQWNDGTPVRTRHHKQWDLKVRAITGGLTIFGPAKGQWVHAGKLYSERVIPVRVMCEPASMTKIVEITMVHYEQLAVMYYLVSNEAAVVSATPEQISMFHRENQRKDNRAVCS